MTSPTPQRGSATRCNAPQHQPHGDTLPNLSYATCFTFFQHWRACPFCKACTCSSCNLATAQRLPWSLTLLLPGMSHACARLLPPHTLQEGTKPVCPHQHRRGAGRAPHNPARPAPLCRRSGRSGSRGPAGTRPPHPCARGPLPHRRPQTAQSSLPPCAGAPRS